MKTPRVKKSIEADSVETSVLRQLYKSISFIVHSEESQEVPDDEKMYSTVMADIMLATEDAACVPVDVESRGLCSEYNVILDLDGTLVHTLPCNVGPVYGQADFSDNVLDFYTFKRPGVDKFLNYLFAHFASVSVWTAGTNDYAKYVVDHITPEGQQFLYILSRENCAFHPAKPGALVKDLRDIWDSYYGHELDITPQNTLIIDDNDEVCFHNVENTVLVPTWGVHTHGDNDSLLKKLIFSFETGAQTEDAREFCSNISTAIA